MAQDRASIDVLIPGQEMEDLRPDLQGKAYFFMDDAWT
jgi:hypothetical protein